MTFARSLAIAALLALAAPAFSGPAFSGPRLTPHTAQYKVKISVVSGQLNTELRSTADGYAATHVIKPTGFSKILAHGTMDVTSEFSDGPDGITPIRYHAVDTIRDDPEVDLEFDWTSNRVSGTVGADAVEFQLDGISHDNVSVQYALMHDLLTDTTREQYILFDVDKLRVANISAAGTKVVKTKAGTFTAVGIRHQKEGSSRTTTMWCVEELGYLPVLIEQHRKGKTIFEAKLTRYTPTPVPAPIPTPTF